MPTPTAPTVRNVNGGLNDTNDASNVYLLVLPVSWANAYEVQFSPTGAFDSSAPIQTFGPFLTPFPTPATGRLSPFELIVSGMYEDGDLLGLGGRALDPLLTSGEVLFSLWFNGPTQLPWTLYPSDDHAGQFGAYFRVGAWDTSGVINGGAKVFSAVGSFTHEPRPSLFFGLSYTIDNGNNANRYQSDVQTLLSMVGESIYTYFWGSGVYYQNITGTGKGAVYHAVTFDSTFAFSVPGTHARSPLNNVYDADTGKYVSILQLSDSGAVELVGDHTVLATL